MYYCVLSMITPPVALASYAAAGLAKADSMKTGWIAFKLSLVLFLIPFAFAFDPALLWNGPLGWIALAFLSMMAATFAWAVFLEGYVKVADRLARAARVLRGGARHHLRAHRPSVVVGRVRGLRRADGLGAAGPPAPAREGAAGVSAKGEGLAARVALAARRGDRRAHPAGDEPSVDPPPSVLLRPAVGPRDAAPRLRLAPDRHPAALRRGARERAARAAHRPGRPRRVVVLPVARRAARLLRRRYRRVAPRPGDARRGAAGGLRRGRNARARHGRRRDGHHRALRRRPLVGGTGEARQGVPLPRHRHRHRRRHGHPRARHDRASAVPSGRREPALLRRACSPTASG